MSKYVRREVRDLLDADRIRVLDAMQTLYHTSQEEGEKQYGSGFKNIAYFMEKHLRGAGARECDHWHDDAGVVTHHVAFTLEFEQALQVVDTTVSMPYWDVTRDSMRQKIDGLLWRESSIFQDEWFGRSAGEDLEYAGGGNGDDLDETSTHVIKTGRWAYTATPRVNADNKETNGFVRNAYGLLRSPWNTNPTPYLTRSGTVSGVQSWSELPSCAEYEECFYSESLAEMHSCLNGATHGPVHIMLGGIWNKKMSSYVTERPQAYLTLLMSKNLWRQGYVQCPESCSADSAVSDCQCSCPVAATGDQTSLEVLEESGVLQDVAGVMTTLHYDSVTGDVTVDGVDSSDSISLAGVFDDVLHGQLCSPGHVGDMYTSASPFDPTFWLIHGSMDRLLQWRRIQAASGNLPFDEKWGYTHGAGEQRTPSETGLVCDWSAVDAGSAERPSCTKDVCPGHAFSDALPFSSFVAASSSSSSSSANTAAATIATTTASSSESAMLSAEGYPSEYTNAQFYEFMSPFNEKLPYMYANFQWTHCDKASVSSAMTSVSELLGSKKNLNTKFVGGLGTGVRARKVRTTGSGFGSDSFEELNKQGATKKWGKTRR